MVGEPSHVKQLSLNRMCKIGLKKHCAVTFDFANISFREDEKNSLN
jgi:hypothetical protein